MINDENPQIAYKDLQVWQKSIEFASNVIQTLENLNSDRKHYRLIDQLESDVTSIPMNIAEGNGRISKEEFIQFLKVARDSICGTLTSLKVFLRQDWIAKDIYSEHETSSIEIIRMLKSPINSIFHS